MPWNWRCDASRPSPDSERAALCKILGRRASEALLSLSHTCVPKLASLADVLPKFGSPRPGLRRVSVCLAPLPSGPPVSVSLLLQVTPQQSAIHMSTDDYGRHVLVRAEGAGASLHRDTTWYSVDVCCLLLGSGPASWFRCVALRRAESARNDRCRLSPSLSLSLSSAHSAHPVALSRSPSLSAPVHRCAVMISASHYGMAGAQSPAPTAADQCLYHRRPPSGHPGPRESGHRRAAPATE